MKEMKEKEFVLGENRGYGIFYAVCYGTEEECQVEMQKIVNNKYDDLEDRKDGDGVPFGYFVCSEEEFNELREND